MTTEFHGMFSCGWFLKATSSCKYFSGPRRTLLTVLLREAVHLNEVAPFADDSVRGHAYISVLRTQTKGRPKPPSLFAAGCIYSVCGEVVDDGGVVVLSDPEPDPEPVPEPEPDPEPDPPEPSPRERPRCLRPELPL